MSQTVVTNNGEPRVRATTVFADVPTVEADLGVATIQPPNIANDGNTNEVMVVDVQGVTNGTFSSVAIDNPSSGGVDFFTAAQLPATMVVPPSAQIGIKLEIAVDEPEPGQQNPDAVVDYTAAWQA